MYAAHFQKTWRHKLFSKTTLLQKASLKSLHSVLAKEGRSLVPTGLCLVTAQQWSLWFRLAPTEFKGVCLKPLEDCATCQQGHASPGNVCCCGGQNGSGGCILHISMVWEMVTRCRRKNLVLQTINPFLGPEDHLDAYSVDSGGTLESGQLHRKVQSWTPRQEAVPDFSVYFVFVSLLFKYLDLKERPCWQQLLFWDESFHQILEIPPQWQLAKMLHGLFSLCFSLWKIRPFI